MTTTIAMGEGTYPLRDPEGGGFRAEDAEPMEEPLLADAEEEELTELWASDRGNQGA